MSVHAVAVALLPLLLTPALAAGDSAAKLDRALRQAAKASPTQPVRVIVTPVPGGRETLRAALELRGGSIEADHTIIDALTVSTRAGSLLEIASLPSVRAVSIDAVLTSHSTALTGTTTSGLRETLGLDATPWTGAGVRVAVVDSGLELTADFQKRVLAFYDFVDWGGAYTSPSDSYGHGSHVAGLIGSSGELSKGAYRGVAPDVKFIVTRVLGSDGAGSTSTVIRALEFLTTNRAALGVDVINLSLGHPIYEPAATDPLVRAVEAAARAGMVVVVAAGNHGLNPETGLPGYAGIASPGNAPSAVTVGAVKTNDTVSRLDDVIAGYSSRGPSWYDAYAKPDIAAPGHGLIANSSRGSYLFRSYPSFRYGSNAMKLSGTSMAAAVTTGAVALMLQAQRTMNPGAPPLPVNAIKAILQFTAFSIGGGADPLAHGAGALNAAGAATLASAIDTTAALDAWWLARSVEPSTVIGGETLAWTQNLVWGSQIASTNAVYTNAAAWGENIVWGTTLSWLDENIVWGTNFVWDENIVWGTNLVWGASLIGYRDGENIVWGTIGNQENIVWGTLTVGAGPQALSSLLVLTAAGL